MTLKPGDAILETMGTVEKRVSDLEDTSTANVLQLDALETTLKRVLEQPNSFENQSRQQKVRIVGQREGPGRFL